MSTLKDFKSILDELEVSVSDFLTDFEYEDYSHAPEDKEQEYKDLLASCKSVSVGGHYDGKEYDIIFKWEDIFIRGSGWYSSWGDSSHEDYLEEVVPVEKTIIQYVNKTNKKG